MGATAGVGGGGAVEGGGAVVGAEVLGALVGVVDAELVLDE